MAFSNLLQDGPDVRRGSMAGGSWRKLLGKLAYPVARPSYSKPGVLLKPTRRRTSQLFFFLIRVVESSKPSYAAAGCPNGMSTLMVGASSNYQAQMSSFCYPLNPLRRIFHQSSAPDSSQQFRRRSTLYFFRFPCRRSVKPRSLGPDSWPSRFRGQ